MLDQTDAASASDVAALQGVTPLVTDTIMGDHASKMRLAQNVLQFAAALAQTTAAA